MQPLLRHAFAGFLASAVVAAPAFAQRDTPAIRPIAIGTRIRVTATMLQTRAPGNRGSDPVIGTLIYATGDSLVLRRASDSTLIAVALSAVQKVESSAGVSPAKLRGARYGVLIGVVAGAFIGAAANREPPKYQCTPSTLFCFRTTGPNGPGNGATRGAAPGGLVGAVTGAVVGAGRVERWAPVDLTSLVRVSVLPSRRGGVVTFDLHI